MRGGTYRKIAIVGGGPAGLAAAFELTKPGLVSGECVTVYQAGWRLGGKCASGRDQMLRIVEHGLHLWFGYYENAFRLLREVYEELPREPRRFQDWRDTFQPVQCTQIGGGPSTSSGRYLPVEWPSRRGSPGDGRRPFFWDSVTGLIELLSQFHDSRIAKGDGPRVAIDPQHARAFEALFTARGALDGASPRDAVRAAFRWSGVIGAGFFDRAHLVGLSALLRGAADALRGVPAPAAAAAGKDRLLADSTDFVAAFVAGLIDNIVMRRMAPRELDETDFRDWLIANGADRQAVKELPLIAALYDTMFQYVEGDRARPSYGAGTAAQVVMRMLGGYKGDAVWKANAGLGEALIAPLYETLRARGVRFAFFHKLERIELTPDRKAIARLVFARQADISESFEPTFRFKGLSCWPDGPPESVKEGVRLGDGLETRWGRSMAGRELRLEQGTDFSEAILAIPLGAFKVLGGKPGPCDELIRASPQFRTMTQTIGLVPSLSVQAWTRKSLAELGWREKTAALVSGPPPLEIWADMSQLLDCEDWGEEGPKSVQYLCAVFASQAFRDPAGAAVANAEARKLAAAWFNEKARLYWPGADGRSATGAARFAWTTLEAPRDRRGAARLDAQVVKANVDPWACCCGSAAGSTAWRLKADESGFRHLFLAGSWIDTGLNTESVEAAVMSGKQASRAICGSPVIVEGENFFRPPNARGLGPLDLARDLLGTLAFARV